MFRSVKLARWSQFILLFGLFSLVSGPLTASSHSSVPLMLAAGPALSVDVGAARHSISPDIYGMNFYGKNAADYTALMQELKLPVNRWGGNVTSRYNWQLNSTNSGTDYFFLGFPNTANNPALGQPSESDQIVARDKANGVKSIITLPMVGYVSKTRTPNVCGFSVAKYGPQQQTAPANINANCGNGKQPNGLNIVGNDPLDVSQPADANFAKAWINDLKAKFGTADNGGVKFYHFDNEPSDWHATHRDIHPDILSYDELRDKTYAYGAAVKAADPGAKTLGPSNYGWYVYQDSRKPGDRAAHGGVGFSEWYLQQMKLYEEQHGVRILDYFDQHYYPAQPGVTLSPAGDAATQARRLRSTRSLWDATYDDESWITTVPEWPVRLLPRFREWVQTNYPGTKLAITEYNWGGLEHINGALAQADVLGIFGRERLDLATMWAPPSSTQPGAFAFRIYRNYDGAGSTYGDTWVQSVSADQGQLAVYGAERSSDGAVTLAIINKTESDLTSPLSLAGFNSKSQAKVYRYSAANLNAIVRQPDLAVNRSGFTTTYPANSITLIVLDKVTNILTVKLEQDNGDETLPDSLSYALKQAQASPGSEIVFALPQGVNTIQVTVQLLPVPQGVIIYAPCTAAGPSLTIDGSGVTTEVNGLELTGRNRLEGVRISGFKGRQIKTVGGGNILKCVAAVK